MGILPCPLSTAFTPPLPAFALVPPLPPSPAVPFSFFALALLACFDEPLRRLRLVVEALSTVVVVFVVAYAVEASSREGCDGGKGCWCLSPLPEWVD